MPPPAPERDPAALLACYGRAPHVHPYGIADVEQLWRTSTWWRRGDAVVGLLDLQGGAVVYAIAADPPTGRATLDLLADLAPELPDRFVITGPSGLAGVLGGCGFRAAWADAYDKLHLPADVVLPPAADDVAVLGRDDEAAVRAVFDADPDAGDFFYAGLLDTGFYLGRRVPGPAGAPGQLAAVAGVHVVDRVNGVAAIGNVATHPAHRRQGHGRAVVVALLHRLRAEVAVIGLNVRHRTAPARAMYDRLGFVHAVTYEEAEVARS